MNHVVRYIWTLLINKKDTNVLFLNADPAQFSMIKLYSLWHFSLVKMLIWCLLRIVADIVLICALFFQLFYQLTHPSIEELFCYPLGIEIQCCFIFVLYWCFVKWLNHIKPRQNYSFVFPFFWSVSVYTLLLLIGNLHSDSPNCIFSNTSIHQEIILLPIGNWSAVLPPICALVMLGKNDLTI
jgi:hypothetical protein